MNMFMKVVSLLCLSSAAQAGHGWYNKPRSRTSGSSSSRQAKPVGNIAEALTQVGATTLVDLVVKAGLAETLSTGGPFTVFAPTNAAFGKLPKSLVDTLVGDKDLLTSVLLFHVVDGKVTSRDLSNDLVATSLQGGPLRANIYSSGGYYGSNVITVNGKKVSKADVAASNGVIHLVDDVLYPIPTESVAEKLGSDPRFSTLLTAIQAAGISLPSSPVTLFAPTNDAFAKVPADALQGLLADKAALTDVLTRHVVDGTVYAAGISSGASLDTLGGKQQIRAAVSRRGGVQVSTKSGKASVVEADIPVTNGVIHAIDSVI